MNFLAHFVLATRYLEPTAPVPAYVLGNALPDLLPLTGIRRHFRPLNLMAAPSADLEDAALCAGVQTHLDTDAAFHQTRTFAQAQQSIKRLLHDGGFTGMRLRPFFLGHVLAELALDAALLRADSTLAASFYADFTAADFTRAAHWAEATLQATFPSLPAVLSRFAHSRYLDGYTTDDGVAEGLARLCARARQDTFEGENFARLRVVVAASVRLLDTLALDLLTETTAQMLME